jgi:hypothetical protein
MKKSNLLRLLFILVTSVVLICVPESSFAAGGHGGGGGGFHGGGGGGFHGGGFGGGFHGGGFGGYHAGWGGAGWHAGWGGYGWRGGWGGYGWRGWGYPGWGVGLGFGWGWGWGSYWAGYPYAYGYPYYYPYYPSYPYYGPPAYAPADPDRYNRGNEDPSDNSQRQNSSYPGPKRSPSVNEIPSTTLASHKTAGDTDSAKYWLSNYEQQTVPRQQVRNVIQALLAMPPEARRRQVESGRYRNFSPEEQELLNQVAQVSPREEPQKNVDRTTPAALRLASQQVQ